MKQKLLCLALSLSLLCSVAPISSLTVKAENSAKAVAQSGLKFGLERGDIVYFAGKDEPLAWRVLDADKTNTNDTSGVFLLSDTVTVSAEHSSSSLTGLKTAYESFFADYFVSPYNAAAMSVSKTDAEYAYSSSTTLNGQLENDTVFALSIAEAKRLDTEEKTLSQNWWLRSGRTLRPFPYRDALYAYVKANGDFDTTEQFATADIVLRPAVNLKKSAVNLSVSDAEQAPLLLPAGDKTASDGKFASYEYTGKYSLCMRDEKIVLDKVYTLGCPKTELRAYVATSVESPGKNDYISFILRKSDGTLSYYARIKQEKANNYYLLTLPTDIDLKNDSLYVFHETVNGDFSSVVTDPKKLCLTHVDGTSESISEKSHRITCTVCGSQYDLPHTFAVREYDFTEEAHRERCTLCGYTHDAKHTITYTENTLQYHKKACAFCLYQEYEEHDFSLAEKPDSADMYEAVCLCGYDSGLLATKGTFSESVAVRRSIYLSGSAAVTGGISYTSDACSALFKEGNQNAVFEGNPSNGQYVVSLIFETTGENCLYGIRFQNSEELEQLSTEYFTHPTKIILKGFNEENKQYEMIASIPVDGFIERASGAVYSFLATKNTSCYSQYSLTFVGNTQYVVCGNITLFGRPKSDLEFRFTGVTAVDTSDYLCQYEDYVCTLLTRTGHPAASSVSVLCDDVDYDGYTYDETSGKLTLPAENRPSDKRFTIRAISDNNTVSVTTELSRLTFNGAATADFGTDYVGTFTDSFGGQKLAPNKGDDCIITLDGQNFTDYVLTDGVLTIPGRYLTGDITICAREAGSVQKETSVVKTQFTEGDDIARYYDSLSDAVAHNLPGGMTVTFLCNIEESSVVITDEEPVVFDLNGYLWRKGWSYFPSPLLEGGARSSIVLRNGTLGSSYDSYPLVTTEGFLRLETDLSSGATPDIDSGSEAYAFIAKENSTFVLDGARLYASSRRSDSDVKSVAAVKAEDNSTVVIKNGLAQSLVAAPLATVNFVNGSILHYTTRTDGVMDYFAALSDGSVLCNTNKERLTDYADGTYPYSIEFCPDPGILLEQPQSLVTYANAFFPDTLSVKASGTDLAYQWYKNGQAVDGATERTLSVSSSVLGTDTYVCYVYSDGYLVKSSAATVEYLCRHAAFDKDSICTLCGKKVLAEISDDNGWVRYTDTDELMAAESALSSCKVTLLCDLTCSTLDFRGADTTLDLNRHLLRTRIRVYGNLTIRNGTVNGEIFSDFDYGGFLTIEDGSYENLNLSSGHALLKSGAFMWIYDPRYDYGNYLPDGYGYRAMATRTFLDPDSDYDGGLQNVEIFPLPYTIVSTPKNAVLPVGSTDNILAVSVKRSNLYTDSKVTYQWYEAGLDRYEASAVYTKTPIEGATEPFLTLPDGLPIGTQKTYAVTVSCAGYERTFYATVSYGAGEPIVYEKSLRRYSEGNRPYFLINSAGNNCIAVFGMYDGDILRDVRYIPLSETDFLRVITYEDLGYLKQDKVRLLIIKDFASAKPLTGAETVERQ